MTSTATASHTHAASLGRPRSGARKRERARARGGILWIVVSGILLTGVVFVNVAVLQLNLRLDTANTQRTKLLAENAALQSQYSSLISSPRIQREATLKLGLVYEDPSQYGYVNVGR